MRFIARVTESKALVIDFVGASLVTTYFRLSDLLFEKCFTVLEGEQSRFLLGLASLPARFSNPTTRIGGPGLSISLPLRVTNPILWLTS